MHIMAAGSLRGALTAILTHFPQADEHAITCEFGPAGLLRRKIEAGTYCDLFLSADKAHPLVLMQQNIAYATLPFITNRLGITTTTLLAQKYPNWLQLLSAPDIIIGTSTPHDDPCGDYVIQLYDKIRLNHPHLANEIQARTRHLVGGKNSPVIPSGQLASQWLIESHQADLFIGYHHYQQKIAKLPNLTTLPIPNHDNIQAIYTMALITKKSEIFANYLLQIESQKLFTEYGFTTLQ
ncbi:substrate-binding domain-containing protein [Providencia sp. SKLX074055]|uniref:substrate-binding domain-containing protein n=1 Tax=Providencia xihuensis TaxID=3342830 RepID=UPI0035C1D916